MIGWFITGTGTEVGKTYVAQGIARALHAEGQRVGVYKPVASGCRWEQGVLRSEDADALWDGAGRPGDLADVCPQMFEAPLAPHLAARAEGKRVDPDLLRSGLDRWRGRCDVLLVEGAGGLMSPISDDDYNATLAEEFGFPLLIVAANRLGVINETLQTLVVAATYGEGLPVAGVVLNQADPAGDSSCDSNGEELRSRCVASVLAELCWEATGGTHVAENESHFKKLARHFLAEPRTSPGHRPV